MGEQQTSVVLNHQIADKWELTVGTSGRSSLSKFELRVFSYDEFEFDELDDVFLGNGHFLCNLGSVE